MPAEAARGGGFCILLLLGGAISAGACDLLIVCMLALFRGLTTSMGRSYGEA